jgi:hypothetical protein
MQIDGTKSQGCPHLIKKFSYLAASQSSESSPCSNVLIHCPLCSPTAPCIWRYNLRIQFLAKHSSASWEAYEEQIGWVLEDDEKRMMKDIWKNHYKIKETRRKGKKGVTPLEVSEQHSSRMAPRYNCHSNYLNDDSPISAERQILKGFKRHRKMIFMPLIRTISMKIPEETLSAREETPPLERRVKLIKYGG